MLELGLSLLNYRYPPIQKVPFFIRRNVKDQYPSREIERYFHSYLLIHLKIQKSHGKTILSLF